jgi:CheY-like chemotaxis protein
MAHIIVIDDDAVLRQIITLTLEAAGHTVIRCENGKKAVEILSYAHPDLLITDLLMPEMDGIETLRAARQLCPALPILAISGGSHGNPDDYLGMAKVFGATETMPKPFRPAELLGVVTRMLGADSAAKS